MSCSITGLYIVLSLIGMGCIPVPVFSPWYGKYSRTNVDEATAQIIIPGQTTKREVLLMLGAPDEVSPDGRSIVYHWAKVRFLLFFMFGYGANLPLEKQYHLLVTFDERGVVTQREVKQGAYQIHPFDFR